MHRLDREKETEIISLREKEHQLQDLHSQLRIAESNCDTARRERERAEKDKEKQIGITATVGIVGLGLTILTGGAAAPIAAVATGACGISIAEFAKREKRARHEVDKYNSEISSTKSSISYCKDRISTIECKIRNLSFDRQSKEKKTPRIPGR